MANNITIYDAAGVKRTVRPVDAKEILAAGGSYDIPENLTIGATYSEADAKAHIGNIDDYPESEPKTRGKRK